MGRRSYQSTDSQGYLKPLPSDPKPKYLELLAEAEPCHRGEADGASPSITYAELCTGTVDSDMDIDNPSLINSSSSLLTHSPERTAGISSGITYAELDTRVHGPPVHVRPPPSPQRYPAKINYTDILSRPTNDLDCTHRSRSNSVDRFTRLRTGLHDRSPSTSLDSLLTASVPPCSSWQDVRDCASDTDSSSTVPNRPSKYSPSTYRVVLPPPRLKEPSPNTNTRFSNSQVSNGPVLPLHHSNV